MELRCGTCTRLASTKLPFHCATCARSALYDLRVEHALALMDREALSRKATDATAGETATLREWGAITSIPDTGSRRWAYEMAVVDVRDTRDRVASVKAGTESLKRELEARKARIAGLKKAITQRRSEFDSLTHELSSRRNSAVEMLDNNIKRNAHRLDVVHNNTVRARVLLSREAASLYGLKQRRRRKGGVIKEDYYIGGLRIVDLRELNCKSDCLEHTNSKAASFAEVTATLTNLCHLVVLTSHYFSLRLPAEITLPHREYPLPTVFMPASSYQNKDVPFPGHAPNSHGSSPNDSNHLDRKPQVRPRPLYLDKPLRILAKEDPPAFKLFLEGVTSLAYNIAWMCRTQGLLTGAVSWEDVCPIGKNLWDLLVAPIPATPASTTPLATNFGSPRLGNDANSPAPSSRQLNQKQEPGSMIGQLSHGTAHSFLGAAEGVEFMRGWKVGSPMSIVVKLRALLEAELAGADWEVLEEREWRADEATQPEEQLLAVRMRPRGGSKATTAASEDSRKASSGRRRPSRGDSVDTKTTGLEQRRLSSTAASAAAAQSAVNDSDSRNDSSDKSEPRSGKRNSGTSGYVKLRPRT